MEVGLRVRDRIDRGCAEGAYVFLQHARVALLVGLALNEPSARHLLTLGCFTSFALEQLSLLLMRELLGVLKLKKLPVSGPDFSWRRYNGIVDPCTLFEHAQER